MNGQNQVGWLGRGNLESLVGELARQRESRMDVVIDSRQLKAVANDAGGLRLAPAATIAEEWLPRDGYDLTDRALMQLGSRLDPAVPGAFARDLAAARPEIASKLVSDLLGVTKSRSLVRCLDGRVRAVLSNSYRVMDNYDLAFTALEVAQASGGEVIEACLSDTNMRLKFTTKELRDTVVDVKKNGGADHAWIGRTGYGGPDQKDLPGGPGTVHPLITISNSETGHGGLSVNVGIVVAWCVNMSIIEKSVGAIHLGGRMDEGFLTEETIAADSKAIMLKARDAIRAAFAPEGFKRIVAIANDAAGDEIKNPSAAVNKVVTENRLSDAAKDSILAHFIRDYDSTRYGLAQAVSRYSQEVSDADVAHDVETLAGRVMAERKLVAV